MSPACRGTQVVGVKSVFFAFRPGHLQGCVSEPFTDPQARAMGEAGHSRRDLGERGGTGCNLGAQRAEALIMIKAAQE